MYIAMNDLYHNGHFSISLPTCDLYRGIPLYSQVLLQLAYSLGSLQLIICRFSFGNNS